MARAEHKPIQTPEEYVTRLRTFDWLFEYSDDHSIWQAGVNELARLKYWQKLHDPDFIVWNLNCPPDFKRTPSA
jgi:hypothetical protein